MDMSRNMAQRLRRKNGVTMASDSAMTERQRERVLLSLQRALIGEVFPALHALWVEWSPDQLLITWLVDEGMNEADRLSMSVVAAEVQADFHEGFVVRSEVKRYPPAFTPVHFADSACVFERRSA